MTEKSPDLSFGPGVVVFSFITGFALACFGLYHLDQRGWNRALASFTCGFEDRVNVFDGETSMCVDWNTAYPSDEALGRLVARIEAAEAAR